MSLEGKNGLRVFLVENKEIALILLMSLALRVYALDGFPEFFVDEGHSVYRALSLLRHGLGALDKSVMGEFVYTAFPSRLFFLLPMALILKLLGVGVVQVRILGVVFSFFLIIAIYKLGFYMYSKNVGLLSALFYSINIMAIIVNREAQHDTPMVLFLVLGMLFLYRGVEKQCKRDIIISGLFMGASVFFKEMGILHIASVFTFMVLLRVFQKNSISIPFVMIRFCLGFFSFIILTLLILVTISPGLLNTLLASPDYFGNVQRQLSMTPLFMRILDYLVFWMRYTNLYMPIISAFSWVGFVYMFLRRRKQDLLIVSWLVTFVALFLLLPTDEFDAFNGSQIMVPFCLSASVFLITMYKKAGVKSAKYLSVFKTPESTAFAFAILLCIIVNLGASVKIILLEQNYTPQQVANWINNNTPEDSMIMANPSICVLTNRSSSYFYFFGFPYATESGIDYFIVDQTWRGMSPGINEVFQRAENTTLLTSIGSGEKTVYIYKYSS